MTKRVTLVVLALSVCVGAGFNKSVSPETSSADLLGTLPEGRMVVIVDLLKVTSSEAWNASTDNPLKEAVSRIQGDISRIGLQLSDIQAAAVVFPALSFSEPLSVFSGTFKQEELVQKLRTSSEVTSEKYRDQEIYTTSTSAHSGAPARAFSFAFYDAETLVAGTQARVRASVDARSGAGPSIARNPKLNSALNNGSTAPIRFAIELTPESSAVLKSSQIPLPDFSSVNLIFGTLNLGTGIDIDATLRNDTPDQARLITERLNGLLVMAKSYFASVNDPGTNHINDALKSIVITGVQADVKITGRFPLEILRQLIR